MLNFRKVYDPNHVQCTLLYRLANGDTATMNIIRQVRNDINTWVVQSMLSMTVK